MPRWRKAPGRLATLGLAAAALLGFDRQASAFTLREVGEWVVSCDNRMTCSIVNASQLTQLRVAQPSPFGMSRLCIHRGADSVAAPQVYLTMRNRSAAKRATAQEALSLRIDTRGAGQRQFALRHVSTDHWEVPPAQAGALLAILGDGAELQVLASDGAALERLPIDGIGPALATIDEAQRRGGGDPPKGSTSLPSAALVTASLSKLSNAPPPSSDALRLRRQVCGSSALDVTVGYRLLGDGRRYDRTLWVTRCDAPSGPRREFFSIESADGQAIPAHFPGVSPARPTGQDGLLAAPLVDATAGIVRERWIATLPAGGSEPCAIQRTWGWNGESFELAEERRSLSCAGIVSGYWPRTFTRPLITPTREGAAAVAASFQPPC